MLRVISTSDTHLGLKTDEIDRNEEIVEVVLAIVGKAVEYKIKGEEVILILGGDIFDNNTPTEKDISALITIFNLIKEHSIKTYVLLGNHEAISDPDRLSCLGFIRKAKVGYPSITLVDDIKFLKVAEFDNGPLYFTFLPHITKGTLEKNHRNDEYLESKTPQDYIDSKAKKILRKVGKEAQHYVFSHLNVRGAHPGSEENLLKKSEVYLPKVFTNTPAGFLKPTIIQYHIHTQQIIDNIHIIGNPIYCGFGEKGSKYYADIEISSELAKKDKINLVKTNYRPFYQCDLDMVDYKEDFFDHPDLREFWNLMSMDVERNPVGKINVTINAENNSYDWTEIRKKIMRLLKGSYVKKIDPKVITARVTRVKEQKMNLDPKEAVKVHLREKVKDKERRKKIYKRATNYLE